MVELMQRTYCQDLFQDSNERDRNSAIPDDVMELLRRSFQLVSMKAPQEVK